MSAAAVLVVADHGDIRVSLVFFAPVALMLLALLVVTVHERRRRHGSDR